MSAAVTTTFVDGVAVASVAGEIDMINHEQLQRDLLTIAHDNGPKLVVDLTRVEYIDSNGIRMLFAVANELSQSRVEWAVALDDDSPVMRLLKVTAFNEVASVFATAADAAASLGDA